MYQRHRTGAKFGSTVEIERNKNSFYDKFSKAPNETVHPMHSETTTTMHSETRLEIMLNNCITSIDLLLVIDW